MLAQNSPFGEFFSKRSTTKLLLDRQLALLKRLQRNRIWSRAAKFLADLAFDPGVFLLQSGDMGVLHQGFSKRRRRP